MIIVSIQSIHLKNFIVFKNFKVDFSSGINIFIGKNGTGKTQLLKSIYAIGMEEDNENRAGFCKYFKDDKIGEIFNDKSKKQAQASLTINENDDKISVIIKKVEDGYKIYSKYNKVVASNVKSLINTTKLKVVYIPVKDMLTHSKGLPEMAERYGYKNFPFDKTLVDIVIKARQWKLKEPPELAQSILPKLEEIIDGKVIIENEEFYIQKNDGRKVNFYFEAEGLKKIGLIWQLLMNESINKDSVLIWDEPEANMNPNFLETIVECLLELSRQGVQIFISTHNYVFSKYFDVICKESDNVAFHSLYFKNTNLKCETEKKFIDLKNNSIMAAFDNLLEKVYDLQ